MKSFLNQTWLKLFMFKKKNNKKTGQNLPIKEDWKTDVWTENCPNTPAAVLMSTFKNDLPENQFVLMNTVRTTRIFTVRLLYMNNYHIFPFPLSKGTLRVEPAVWKSGTTGSSVKCYSDKVKNLPNSAKYLLKQTSDRTMMLSKENKGWCVFLRNQNSL